MYPLLKIYCLSMVFFKIAAMQKVDFYELITLAGDVQEYYLSRSIFIVYSGRLHDFDKEQLLILDAIKRHQYLTSQVITYDQLNQTSSHRENVLHVLLIRNVHDFQIAINATKNVDMSLHPWLLYFTKTSNFDCNNPPKKFFKLKMNTDMAAKCEGNKMLKRYHSVFEGQMEVVDLAEWLLERRLRFINTKRLSEIGTNMKGIKLKLATRATSIEDANKNLFQFQSHLTEELEILGNFSTEITDQKYTVGYYDNSTHNWTGLMGVIEEKKADIGMYLFSMSSQRMNVVDFVSPIGKTNFYLYAKLPDSKRVLWSAYFKAFDFYTWLAIISLILVVCILLSLVKNKYQGLLLGKISENALVVWGISCLQGPAVSPKSNVTQIIYFSILIKSLILHAIYSATMTSYIANLSPKLPFDTYEEFKLDNSYKVTILKGSQDQDLILGEDKYLEPLKSRLSECYEWPVNPYEGYRQACEEKTAFYSDDATFQGIKYGPPCQLGTIDMDRAEYASFILTKNSPYTKTINYFINRLRDYGILKRLKDKYYYQYTELPTNEPNVITLGEVLPIITVWLFGVISSVIVLFLELVTFHLL